MKTKLKLYHLEDADKELDKYNLDSNESESAHTVISSMFIELAKRIDSLEKQVIALKQY